MRTCLLAMSQTLYANIFRTWESCPKAMLSGCLDGKPRPNRDNIGLARLGLASHGFRSTFRDWAAEMTNYLREVTEMGLAHTVSDKVEAAYRRGDLFTKRKRLMSEWALHVCGGGGSQGAAQNAGYAGGDGYVSVWWTL